MAISSLFTRFKGLGPVFVVGTAVIVTIKLLTTKTPTIEESFNVDVEEDIAKTTYEEKIEVPPEPEPEPEPEVEKTQEKEPEDKEEKEEEGEEKQEEDQGDSESPDQEKEEKKEAEPEPPKPPASNRMFNSSAVGQMLSKLFAKDKKQ